MIRMTIFIFFLMTADVSAIMIDRVVAFIDNDAITETDLEKRHERDIKNDPGITLENTLNSMINERLLINDAQKKRIIDSSDAETINKYIDITIRSQIRISGAQIEDYYERNKVHFKGMGIDKIGEEIKKYLTELEVNERLTALLKNLREHSYVENRFIWKRD